jgi:transcriptional regulator with XRE-family HTH domain
MTRTTSETVRQNGPAVRALRQREGLTVDALSKRVTAAGINLSVPHLRNIENEHKNASVAHLAAIAKALDVPLAAIRRDAVDSDEAGAA